VATEPRDQVAAAAFLGDQAGFVLRRAAASQIGHHRVSSRRAIARTGLGSVRKGDLRHVRQARRDVLLAELDLG
jgi:hypothetical protein